MTDEQLTRQYLLTIWSAFYWRAQLVGGLVGGLLGFIVGIILTLIGLPGVVQPTSFVVGFIVGIPVSMWAMREILQKKFSGFRLRIETTEDVF